MGKVIDFEKSETKADTQELLHNYRLLDKRGKHEVHMAIYLQLDRMHNEHNTNKETNY